METNAAAGLIQNSDVAAFSNNALRLEVVGSCLQPQWCRKIIFYRGAPGLLTAPSSSLNPPLPVVAPISGSIPAIPQRFASAAAMGEFVDYYMHWRLMVVRRPLSAFSWGKIIGFPFPGGLRGSLCPLSHTG